MITLRKASSVEPKLLEWLWPSRIPKGKITVLAGNPGVGKGLITCDLTATLTTGRKFPDCPNENTPIEVAMLACEDGEADTIRPRLEAAGADLDRVHFIDSTVRPNDKTARLVALDRDVSAIREVLKANPNIQLVVIDPISSYLGSARMEKEQEVRRVLGPLAQLAEETGVTFFLVMHFNKRGDVGALHRVTGAVAMTGVARAVWVCVPDPDSETNLLLPVKMNIARKAPGLRYGIEEKPLSFGLAPFIVWRGATDTTADQALSAKAPTGKLEKAKAFLEETLVIDTPAKEIYQLAEQNGISAKTLQRAKMSLEIPSDRIVDEMGEAQWYWLAPPKPGPLSEAYGDLTSEASRNYVSDDRP